MKPHHRMTFKEFRCLLNTVLLVAIAIPVVAQQEKQPIIRVGTPSGKPIIRTLTWDTEHGGRSEQNLLRGDVGLHLQATDENSTPQAAMPSLSDSPLFPKTTMGVEIKSDRKDRTYVRIGFESTTKALLNWTIDSGNDDVSLSIGKTGQLPVNSLELVFPFDPLVTPTTVLPHAWLDDGSLQLPAIISAPDFGQILVSCAAHPNLSGRLEGSREKHTVDFSINLAPVLQPGDNTFELKLTPVYLPAPAGLTDTARWQRARRGWFNIFQCSAAWGEKDRPFSAPAGMLANNVISDPASCSLWFYADQAFFTPQLAPDISAMDLVRRTLDWWLDKKILPDGEVICYWDKAHFLDANAGPLIAAWDYVESTHDTAWLTRRIDKLEFIASYLLKRDIDNDGLIEAEQSGNANTLIEPLRSCAWWDALNCGHKDAYTNAIIYRAFRCLADLERQLNRTEQAARFTSEADRLNAAYFPKFFNPKTGMLAWWISADGEVHDYASPTTNGIAIEYDLVPTDKAREILARLRAKLNDVKFTRYDLGVPPMLVPVRRADYLQPDGAGCPKREDGTDTFGYYMNGGITAGQVLHFLDAQYAVGDKAPADKILDAMLVRQQKGEFQNGTINAYPKGIDWTTWDGKPAGYEGYLADSYRFLQATVMREPQLREKLLRPLLDQRQ